MAKVEVLTASPRQRFDGAWQGSVDVLQSGEQVSPTLAGIDIEHYQPGDCSGDDTHIGVGPPSPPSLDLVDSSGDKHALLPGAVGVLAWCRARRIAARAAPRRGGMHRDDRPPTCHRVKSCSGPWCLRLARSGPHGYAAVPARRTSSTRAASRS